MACSWLTTQEAADWIKVHKHTVDRWIREGRLKVQRFGGPRGAVRICLDDLNNLGKEDSGAQSTLEA